LGRRSRNQSGFARENFTTFAHFPVSSTISLPKSAGVPGSARLVEELAAFATRRGHTMLERAFSSLLHEPVVAGVIAGATTPEQDRTGRPRRGLDALGAALKREGRA
jgi:aryl-alcohol dehydrogenase-like predicted oxidoreductase